MSREIGSWLDHHDPAHAAPCLSDESLGASGGRRYCCTDHDCYLVDGVGGHEAHQSSKHAGGEQLSSY